MRLSQRFLAWFNGLDPARRVRLLAAVVIAVVAAVGLSVWGARVDYAPILSGRGYEAALAAASAVDRAGIPYRIVTPDTLEVPVDKLGAAQGAIASETDLPGLTDVSDLQLGLTPKAQDWAFLRAAEGDIARMLNGIGGIAGSQIHIVPRGQSLYIGEERPASASVFLKLEPGTELGSSQIRAVVSLVANSVDGLDSDHVSVADDRGNLLAVGDGSATDDAMGEMKSLVEYRAALEGRYERAVSQVLLPVLGYGGGFSVTANVDLDPVSKETTTRQLDSEKQAVVSQVDEESSENRSRAGGVPGVDANLPEKGPSTAGSPDDASTRTSSTVNFAYPSVDEISRRPAGGVQRVSVAVQVDAARLAALVEGSNGALDADTLKRQIDGAVSAAIGFDTRRNDLVNVSYLPFAPPIWTEGTAADATTPMPEMVVRLLPYLVAVVALVLLFWFVVRPVVGAVVRPLEPEVVAGELVPPTQLALKEDPDTLALRLKALVDGYQPIDHADLNRLVDSESEMAADVLRNWARAR